MSTEGKFFDNSKNEQDKKKEKKENLDKIIDFQRKKAEIRNKIEAQEGLENLKRLVSEGIISSSIVDAIISGDEFNFDSIDEKIREIFSKIEEINEIDSLNTVIPKELKFTKEEYLEALGNDDKKIALLEKIDSSLDYIYSSNGGGTILSSLFSTLFFRLAFSKNTILVQENLIDVKRSLN